MKVDFYITRILLCLTNVNPLMVIGINASSFLTMSTPSANDIFITNPYAGHPELTSTESDVLWEYAKLAQNVKLVSFPSRAPD